MKMRECVKKGAAEKETCKDDASHASCHVESE